MATTTTPTLDVILLEEDWHNPSIKWGNGNGWFTGEYPSDILQFAQNLINLNRLPNVEEIDSSDGTLHVHVITPNEYDVVFMLNTTRVPDFLNLLDHLNEFPHINSLTLYIVSQITVKVDNQNKNISVTDNNMNDSLVSEIVNRQVNNYYRIFVSKFMSYGIRYLNHPNISYQIRDSDIWIMQGCIYMNGINEHVDYARFFDCVDDVRYIQVPSIMVAVEDMVNRFWTPLLNYVRAHPNIKLGAYHIPRPIQQQQKDWWFTLPQFEHWEYRYNILSYHDGNVMGLVPKYKGYVLNHKDEMNDGGILIIHTLNMSIAMLKTIKNQIEKSPEEGIWVYDPQTDRMYHARQIQFKLMNQSYYLGMELIAHERQFEDNVETSFNQLSSKRTRADYYGHDLFNPIPIHFRGQIPIVDQSEDALRNIRQVVNQGIIFYRIPHYVRGRGPNYHLWDARLRSYGLIPYNSDTLDPPEFVLSIVGFMYLYATYNRLTYMGVRLPNDILQELRRYLFHTMNREELMNDILDRIHQALPAFGMFGGSHRFVESGM